MLVRSHSESLKSYSALLHRSLTNPGLPLCVPGYGEPGVALLPLHGEEAGLQHEVVPQVPGHEPHAHSVARHHGARRLLDAVPEVMTWKNSFPNTAKR